MVVVSPVHAPRTVGLRPWDEADAQELGAMHQRSRAELALEEPWCMPSFFTAAGRRARARRCSEAGPTRGQRAAPRRATSRQPSE